jgi:hypothetical protein
MMPVKIQRRTSTFVPQTKSYYINYHFYVIYHHFAFTHDRLILNPCILPYIRTEILPVTV